MLNEYITNRILRTKTLYSQDDDYWVKSPDGPHQEKTFYYFPESDSLAVRTEHAAMVTFRPRIIEGEDESDFPEWVLWAVQEGFNTHFEGPVPKKNPVLSDKLFFRACSPASIRLYRKISSSLFANHGIILETIVIRPNTTEGIFTFPDPLFKPRIYISTHGSLRDFHIISEFSIPSLDFEVQSKSRGKSFNDVLSSVDELLEKVQEHFKPINNLISAHANG